MIPDAHEKIVAVFVDTLLKWKDINFKVKLEVYWWNVYVCCYQPKDFKTTLRKSFLWDIKVLKVSSTSFPVFTASWRNLIRLFKFLSFSFQTFHAFHIEAYNKNIYKLFSFFFKKREIFVITFPILFSSSSFFFSLCRSI